MASTNPIAEDDPAYVGNKFFVQQEYEKALCSYSTAIEKYPDTVKLYANRALTYLRLDRPFDALKDLDDGSKLDPNNDKLIYRKCKALLALRRFSDAGQFLDESIGRLEHLTMNKDFKTLIEDTNRLKAEYERGQYDMFAMYEETKKSIRLENHADYYAWNKIEIREVEGKGRGLVAKEKIDVGQLLIGGKAFVFVPDSGADTVGIMMDDIGKKLSNRPDLAEKFYRLYAGPQFGYLENGVVVGGSETADLVRIKSIIRCNFSTDDSAFAAPSGDPTNGGEYYGLWFGSSCINHSCIDTNCIRYFVGDYVFVRATKPIEKDEEIHYSYVSASKSFDVRQRVCRLFEFDCQCRLCVKDRQESIETKQRMEDIHKFLDNLDKRKEQVGSIPSDVIPTLKEFLRQLLQRRPERDLNYLALRVQGALATSYYDVNRNEFRRLMMEYYEIQKSNGEFREILKAIQNATRFKGEDEQDKIWIMEARRISKLVFGDERMRIC